MDVAKRHQREACRFYYNPRKREVPGPRQVPRSNSEVVRFHNVGGRPSRSASSGNLTERSYRRTHFQGMPAPRPTRDVLEASHFHLAAKTRRASPRPKQSIPMQCMREACRFHIEPFVPGRSSPLRKAERTSLQAKTITVSAMCEDNVLDQRSCSPNGGLHSMATAPSEQRMQRARSWAPDRCQHIDGADAPTTLLAIPSLLRPVDALPASQVRLASPTRSQWGKTRLANLKTSAMHRKQSH